MIDPRDASKEEQMVYLQAELLRALCAMRELEPDNYLVRLISRAINGELVERQARQRELPFIERKRPGHILSR